MLDDVRGNVRRTAYALIACFGVIAAALGYWQVVRADLATDGANPRIAEQRRDEPRGRILDRNGVVLADSDGARRHYADPSLVHTIGFHSERFGDTDLEAAFDADLRGARPLSPLDRLLQQFLEKPPTPSDLVLT